MIFNPNYEKLSPDAAVQIDELLATSGLRSAEVMSALLELEMKDRIIQLPGKAFIKKL